MPRTYPCPTTQAETQAELLEKLGGPPAGAASEGWGRAKEFAQACADVTGPLRPPPPGMTRADRPDPRPRCTEGFLYATRVGMHDNRYAMTTVLTLSYLTSAGRYGVPSVIVVHGALQGGRRCCKLPPRGI